MIALDKQDGLWILTIDRPDKANSLTGSMLEILADHVETAQSEARALILTGTGKVFSAGADLDEARAGLATSSVWERLSGAVANFPGLSIAALNGTVAGGAMGMVLACDLRVATPNAKAFYPVMKLGFLPQPSDPGRLAMLVGPARAKLILMAGARVEAEAALSYGLYDELVDNPLAWAKELSADVLGADPHHAAAIKNMV